MKIAFVQIWYAEKMGYIEKFLPRAMAALGHEVHLVTTNVQAYFNLPEYEQVYGPFCGPGVTPCEVTPRGDGVTLHRLPHGWSRGRLCMRELPAKLRELRPDIVQGFELNCTTTTTVALLQPWLRYALFLESHIHASVFADARARRLPWRRRAAWRLYRATKGRMISAATSVCHPISPDAADIAVRFFGMASGKVRVASLGTDTGMFRPSLTPADLEEREALRARLGFESDELVCVYSGRLTREKGPQTLAQAVARLRQDGRRARGLFIGAGPREIEDALRRTPGCVVHPFVPVDDLPALYRAADVAVWPRQESTSQLDAAASGLPLILSDQVQVRERIEGNGLTYRENDSADLAARIASLLDADVRRSMGAIGRARMVSAYDWRLLAQQRLAEYETALARMPSRRSAATAPASATLAASGGE